MSESVGVLSPVEVFSEPVPELLFKREALLFERIAVPHLDCLIADANKTRRLTRPLTRRLISQLEWLVEKG